MGGCELHCHLKPLVHEALKVILRDLGRDPVLFLHGYSGKEKQHFLNPNNPPFSFPSFFSLSFFLGTGNNILCDRI
jgi:hypothetical protein